MSGRPIAHRAFSVLLVALLLGSVVAPIAASSPAAAQTDETDSCLYESVDWLAFECSAGSIETTSYDGDPVATQTTLHGMAVSEHESEEAIATVLENYGEDTQSIASIEARHALATAYQQGENSSVADQWSRDNITEYYTQKSINTLEAYEKQQAQLAHIGNITNEPELAQEIVYNPIRDATYMGNNDIPTWKTPPHLTGEMRTYNYTLPNGSEYQYKAAEHRGSLNTIGDRSLNSDSDMVKWAIPLDATENADGSFDITPYLEGDSIVDDLEMHVSGQVNVRNSYYNTSYDMDNGLDGQNVHKLRNWRATLQKWDTQRSDVYSTYSDGFAADLYAEMDAGNLDPNELRGAEGMVRYLSGGSNASEGDLTTALNYVLGTSNPNLTDTSTMRINVDGYTGVEWQYVNGTRTANATNPMNATVEGLLFADGVDTVSAGETYATNATDSTTFTIVREDGSDVSLIEGNMTIEAIYDSDGNEVDNATYADPKYGTYNASEFIRYLEENEEVRNAIVSDDDDGGPGFGLPNFGLSGNGGTFVGLAIIGVAVLVVVGVVTDLIPGVGN